MDVPTLASVSRLDGTRDEKVCRQFMVDAEAALRGDGECCLMRRTADGLHVTLSYANGSVLRGVVPSDAGRAPFAVVEDAELTGPDGTTIVGQMREHDFAGQVLVTFRSTDLEDSTYAGTMRHGAPHGPGTLTTRSAIMRGDWTDGRMSGPCVVRFDQPGALLGEWLERLLAAPPGPAEPAADRAEADERAMTRERASHAAHERAAAERLVAEEMSSAPYSTEPIRRLGARPPRAVTPVSTARARLALAAINGSPSTPQGEQLRAWMEERLGASSQPAYSASSTSPHATPERMSLAALVQSRHDRDRDRDGDHDRLLAARTPVPSQSNNNTAAFPPAPPPPAPIAQVRAAPSADEAARRVDECQRQRGEHKYIFEGEMREGLFDGPGVLAGPEFGYVGEFRAGVPQGAGVLCQPAMVAQSFAVRYRDGRLVEKLAPDSQAAELRRQVAELKRAASTDTNTCKICYDAPANVLLTPCRHLVTCHGCDARIQRCPVCRASIDAHIVVLRQ